MSMRSLGWLLMLALVLYAAPASAKHVHFTGPHPISARFGGGYCYIEAPHVHVYAPDRPALYHEDSDGGWRFVADPTPFGYEGPRATFYGHHPVPGVPSVYCYLDGPHYHSYEPPSDSYKMEKGVAFYVGPFDPVYERERPRRAKLFAVEYRPFTAARPVVEVQPPPEWHGGEVYVAGPPGVVVVAPPMPSVTVVAPPPPHITIVGPPPPRVFVPRPSVMFAPPMPGVVVIGPGGGPRRERDDDDDEHGHRDHGKHKGWFKHGGGDDHEHEHEGHEGHGHGDH